jgi:hypothetical protein
MKPRCLLFFIVLCLWGCNQQQDGSQKLLQTKIDSLQKTIDNAYKPGLGEFMSSIQVHHEKLWFAGKNENWKLADFEIKEIQEDLTDITTYCKDRPETHFLPMIDPALDSLNKAIQQKSSASFKNKFILLTNTCNSCHQATKLEFNVIKVPDVPAFSDQVFKPRI